MLFRSAIEYLKIYKPICTCTHRSDEITKADEAFDMAIEALKQLDIIKFNVYALNSLVNGKIEPDVRDGWRYENDK